MPQLSPTPARCRIGVGFQTARQHSTIGNMNIERKIKEARRKTKAEVKRARRAA
jgi:hypothetical protein